MKEITYTDSKNITKASQLREVFRDHCGIMIDGIIYTSIQSIMDINQILSTLREWEYEHYADPEPFNADSSEFKRISNLITNIIFE